MATRETDKTARMNAAIEALGGVGFSSSGGTNPELPWRDARMVQSVPPRAESRIPRGLLPKSRPTVWSPTTATPSRDEVDAEVRQALAKFSARRIAGFALFCMVALGLLAMLSRALAPGVRGPTQDGAALVEVEVLSEPPHAQVYGEDGRFLGRAPVRFWIPSDEPARWSVFLALVGHMPARMALAGPGRVTVHLEPERPVRVPCTKLRAPRGIDLSYPLLGSADAGLRGRTLVVARFDQMPVGAALVDCDHADPDAEVYLDFARHPPKSTQVYLETSAALSVSSPQQERGALPRVFRGVEGFNPLELETAGGAPVSGFLVLADSTPRVRFPEVLRPRPRPGLWLPEDPPLP